MHYSPTRQLAVRKSSAAVTKRGFGGDRGAAKGAVYELSRRVLRGLYCEGYLIGNEDMSELEGWSHTVDVRSTH